MGTADSTRRLETIARNLARQLPWLYDDVLGVLNRASWYDVRPAIVIRLLRHGVEPRMIHAVLSSKVWSTPRDY